MGRIARVTEVISASTTSFEDAIRVGFERAKRTLRGITGVRVLEQSLKVVDEEIVEYRVRLEIVFLLDPDE